MLKDHLRDVKDKWSTRTRINHMLVLIPFTAWCKMSFIELTKSDLGDYFDTLEGKAESTIIAHKKTIKTFLKSIKPELAATIKAKQIKNNTTPDSLLSENDITAMINAAPNARDRALIAVMWDSGSRRAEFLSTTVADAKFDKYGCQLWLRESKTGARPARLVFATSYLREWLDVHPRKNDPTAPIFCSFRKPHNLISRTGLYDLLQGIAKRAGVKKKVNPHNWRHTRATDLAKKITEQEMKAVLGWTAGSHQTETYVHLSAMDINKAMLKAAGIEVEGEDQEPSLLATERCPRCKEINDKNRELCFKCGLPLSEKSRRDELEIERKAKEAHDKELIEKAKKEAITEFTKVLVDIGKGGERITYKK